jgi:PhzF family phenazine biosynthesis protein
MQWRLFGGEPGRASVAGSFEATAMTLKLWQIDAFAAQPFEGNPAAIVPLDTWIEAALMQKIAEENNLAETAFFVRRGEGRYELRWFTPSGEVDLCGHATLASAWLIFERLEPGLGSVSFETRSGALVVKRGEGGVNRMSLPSDIVAPYEEEDGFASQIGEALGIPPASEIFRGRYVMAVWDKPEIIRAIRDCGHIADVLRPLDMWGLIVTAPGDAGYDFVSRFFAPDKGVPEDPVTGSAHCALAPFWAKRLGRTALRARQESPRGGDLFCVVDGARTILSGPCALYLEGEIAASV